MRNFYLALCAVFLVSTASFGVDFHEGLYETKTSPLYQFSIDDMGAIQTTVNAVYYPTSERARLVISPVTSWDSTYTIGVTRGTFTFHLPYSNGFMTRYVRCTYSFELEVDFSVAGEMDATFMSPQQYGVDAYGFCRQTGTSVTRFRAYEKLP